MGWVGKAIVQCLLFLPVAIANACQWEGTKTAMGKKTKPQPPSWLCQSCRKKTPLCSDWRGCRAKCGTSPCQWIGKSWHEIWKNQLMWGVGKWGMVWFTSSHWGHLADGELWDMCWHCSKLLCHWGLGGRRLILKIWKKKWMCLFSWVPFHLCWLSESHVAVSHTGQGLLVVHY